jgi:ribosomal protein S18 acetylase RimI-like enzyme
MRLAVMEDWPQVELMLRGYLQEQEDVGGNVLFTRRTLDRYRDLARQYLQGHLFGIVVLGETESEAGSEVVGFTLAGEDGGTPAVDLTHGRSAVVWIAWVAREHRKSGIGLGMLLYGWPSLVEMGFQTALMAVREGNPQGEALCHAFGAKPMERSFSYELKETPHGLRRHDPAE